ncbi:hypothetical protein AB5I41_27840 [Sphingomonas sp. MMS24-JH45]
MIDRRWAAGDRIAVTLPMRLTAEELPDDTSTVAFLHGPLVLAADLGAAEASFDGVGPARSPARPPGRSPPQGRHSSRPGALGEPLSLRPFFAQHDRRTAVSFPTFTPGAWGAAPRRLCRARRSGGRARAADRRHLPPGRNAGTRERAIIDSSRRRARW